MSRILVVDDDDDISTLVAYRLQSSGHEVLIARDGAAGLAATRLERPDLVVLDWMMPGMTGVEVCAAVKSDPQLERTPILLLTAKSRSADVEYAYSVGADDYMLKPFMTQELVNRVEILLVRALQ